MSFENISESNLLSSFDIEFIHGQKSVFYGASGLDTSAVKCLFPEFDSFVQIDYSHAEADVATFMKKAFVPLGFKLIGMSYIPEKLLTPTGFRPSPLRPNPYEMGRLGMQRICDLFNATRFTPFALWAIYEYMASSADNLMKGKRISLLHVGAEAVATFDALYLGYRKNPGAVCIFDSSSKADSDNWTQFNNPDFRFYKMVLKNHMENQTPMPRVLMSDILGGASISNVWPDYENPVSCLAHDSRFIYKYNKND